jgi:hypothetical protein
MLAAAWLAESTGRPAYLTAAETYWDRIYNGPNTTWQSLVPDWNNQWWAGNVILARLTDNPRYQVESHMSQPAVESLPRLEGISEQPAKWRMLRLPQRMQLLPYTAARQRRGRITQASLKKRLHMSRFAV